jgi:hypothetical protein
MVTAYGIGRASWWSSSLRAGVLGCGAEVGLVGDVGDARPMDDSPAALINGGEHCPRGWRYGRRRRRPVRTHRENASGEHRRRRPGAVPFGGHRLVAASRFPSWRWGQGSATDDRVSDSRRARLTPSTAGTRSGRPGGDGPGFRRHPSPCAGPSRRAAPAVPDRRGRRPGRHPSPTSSTRRSGRCPTAPPGRTGPSERVLPTAQADRRGRVPSTSTVGRPGQILQPAGRTLGQ